MPIFRKRPLAVQAEQWFPDRDVPGVFLDDWPRACPPQYYVVTIHGERAYLQPGDWVIAECDGIHHYPCKPDVFEATYIPV